MKVNYGNNLNTFTKFSMTILSQFTIGSRIMMKSGTLISMPHCKWKKLVNDGFDWCLRVSSVIGPYQVFMYKNLCIFYSYLIRHLVLVIDTWRLGDPPKFVQKWRIIIHHSFAFLFTVHCSRISTLERERPFQIVEIVVPCQIRFIWSEITR